MRTVDLLLSDLSTWLEANPDLAPSLRERYSRLVSDRKTLRGTAATVLLKPLAALHREVALAVQIQGRLQQLRAVIERLDREGFRDERLNACQRVLNELAVQAPETPSLDGRLRELSRSVHRQESRCTVEHALEASRSRIEAHLGHHFPELLEEHGFDLLRFKVLRLLIALRRLQPTLPHRILLDGWIAASFEDIKDTGKSLEEHRLERLDRLSARYPAECYQAPLKNRFLRMRNHPERAGRTELLELALETVEAVLRSTLGPHRPLRYKKLFALKGDSIRTLDKLRGERLAALVARYCHA
ncbi:MAG: hypothetical protein A2284_08455 [Deltaproteobacteria bacterium RIFOXYA12_FULL_61_11]|nr:MAG: hypothetical protein A2284_08455 [Deltaproteobacteria bacterium RIFOXYA12_FULL_61_11]